MQMRIGSVVRPARGSGVALRSGGAEWLSAVVACVQPFILVCAQSDMRWSTHKAEDFEVVGTAPAETINAIQWRLGGELHPDDVQYQVRVPCEESFFSNRLSCGLTLVSLGLEVLAVDLNEKIKTWPVMGGWAEEIGKDDNPSYGWVFRYDAEENLWRAKSKVPESMLARWKQQADAGMVELGFADGTDGCRAVKLFQSFTHTELSNEHPVIRHV